MVNMEKLGSYGTGVFSVQNGITLYVLVKTLQQIIVVNFVSNVMFFSY